MHKIYDVAIVGASIAGSSLAMRLGKAGVSVALIEKNKSPRRKPCGEGLSGRGVAVLAELGLEADLLELPHQTLSGFRIWRTGRVSEIALHSDCFKIKSIGIQRSYLDNMLFKAATKCSCVDSFLGQQIRRVEKQNELWVLQSDKLTTRARHVVLADGANSFVARKLEIPLRRHAADRFGYSVVLEGKFDGASRAVNVFVEDKFEIYCTAVAPNRLTMALLGSAHSLSVFSKKATFESLVQRISERVEFCGKLVESPQGIGPLGKASRKAHHNGIFLIGDCCESLDPIAGMGMTHALLSARCAGHALLSIFKQENTIESALNLYQFEREKAAKPLRGFTQLTQFSLGHLPQKVFHAFSRSSIAKRVSVAIHQVPPRSDSPILMRLMELLLSIVGFLHR